MTQNRLRGNGLFDLGEMINFVHGFGIWTRDAISKFSGHNSAIISISRFEDGRLYVHDGHHRICATLIAGRNFLYETEYQIKDWRYSDYTEYNPSNDWFTPFDPRTHCRKPSFFDFKEVVKKLHTQNPDSAVEYQLNNKELYLEYREKETFNDLII